jgi:hypothetical protein
MNIFAFCFVVFNACAYMQKLSSTGDHRLSLARGFSELRDDGKKLVSVGLWKQLREKFHTLQSELIKWLSIRDQLGVLIENFLMSINRVHGLWSMDNELEE